MKSRSNMNSIYRQGSGDSSYSQRSSDLSLNEEREHFRRDTERQALLQLEKGRAKPVAFSVKTNVAFDGTLDDDSPVHGYAISFSMGDYLHVMERWVWKKISLVPQLLTLNLFLQGMTRIGGLDAKFRSAVILGLFLRRPNWKHCVFRTLKIRRPRSTPTSRTPAPTWPSSCRKSQMRSNKVSITILVPTAMATWKTRMPKPRKWWSKNHRPLHNLWWNKSVKRRAFWGEK